MDVVQIRHLLDSERRTGVLDGDEVEVLPLITRTHSADRSRHSVCFSALSDDNADENIAEQVEHLPVASGAYPASFLLALTPPDVFLRLFGGVCSTAWTDVRWRLNTSARLNDFSAEEPDPGQKPQTIVPL